MENNYLERQSTPEIERELAKAIAWRQVRESELDRQAMVAYGFTVEEIESREQKQAYQQLHAMYYLRKIDNPDASVDLAEVTFAGLFDKLIKVVAFQNGYEVPANELPEEREMAILQTHAMLGDSPQFAHQLKVCKRVVGTVKSLAVERGVTPRQVFDSDELYGEAFRRSIDLETYILEELAVVDNSAHEVTERGMLAQAEARIRHIFRGEDEAYIEEQIREYQQLVDHDPEMQLIRKHTEYMFTAGNRAMLISRIEKIWRTSVNDLPDHLQQLLAIPGPELASQYEDYQAYLTDRRKEVAFVSDFCVAYGWDKDNLTKNQVRYIFDSVEWNALRLETNPNLLD